jgi:hypothetical protein
MRPTTAYLLERLLRRRLRAALVKTACLLLLLVVLCAGWSRRGHDGAARHSHLGSSFSRSPHSFPAL